MSTDYGEHDPRNIPDPYKRESTRDLLRKHGHGSPFTPKITPKAPDADRPRETSVDVMRRGTRGLLPMHPRQMRQMGKSNKPKDVDGN